jgi:hypothetical protein
LRGFALIDRRHVLIVDEIVPKARLSSVDWQMHTAAKVELSDAMAALTYPTQSGGAEPPRFYLRIVDPAVRTFSVLSATPAEPPGQKPNTGVAKLVLHLEQVERPVRLAVLLSPDAGACASPELPLALPRLLSDWVQRGHARPR